MATSDGDERRQQRGDEHLGHQAAPDHAVPADRGDHGADDAADQRVRRAGRDAEQPGQQIPDDAADEAGEHDARASPSVRTSTRPLAMVAATAMDRNAPTRFSDAGEERPRASA